MDDDLIRGVVYIDGHLWRTAWQNDWAIQNTVEDSRPSDIYFFELIPPNYN